MSEGRWPVGESELQNLIEAGELEEVEPSPEHADLLMRQAETHLASTPALLPADPPGAFAVVVKPRPETNRKAGNSSPKTRARQSLSACSEATLRQCH